MNEETGSSFAEDDPLDQVLAEYLLAVDSGNPAQQVFLDRYPQFAGELREFFANQEQFERAAEPFRFEPDATTGSASTNETAQTTVPGQADQAAPAQRVRYFGEYELLEEIARGGMGVVFKAKQVRLNRIVALKMILAGQFASAEDVRRFQVEAQSAAQLDHPNIVPVYEVGKHKGQHYFTMKLIDGGSLAGQGDHFAKTPQAAARLLATVARAVHYGHQRGILHRDIKPGNILLGENGQPQITDFGLARRLEDDKNLTLSGALVGSPKYMSPEQARSEKVLTVATDVWGLGAVLYELLTGKPAFDGPTALAVLEQVKDAEPPRPWLVNPAVERDLGIVCLKCLSKDPRERYYSAEALAEDLERWLRHEPIAAQPGATWQRAAKWARRRPAPAALLGVSVLSAILIGGGLVSSNLAIRHQQKQTRQALVRESQAHDEVSKANLAIEATNRTLTETLHKERQTAYFRGITLADREWQADDLSGAEANLNECDPPLRNWEWHYLKRQFHRELVAINITGEYVNHVSFSPDGRRLAVSCGSVGYHEKHNDVKIFDALTGKEICTYRATNGVFETVFSSDGSKVASAGKDKTVQVWDPETGKNLATLKRPSWVLSTAFSPDGNRLISGDGNGNLTLWDVATGNEVRTVKGHDKWVQFVTYNPAGTQVASCADDGRIVIWDAELQHALITIEKPHAPLTANSHASVFCVGFSPDGRTLVSSGSDGTARTFDALTGNALVIFRGHRCSSVYRAAFSPDGRRIASVGGSYYGGGDPGEVKIWSATDGTEIYSLHGNSGCLTGVAFDSSGRRLATADVRGSVKIWDADTGQQSRLVSPTPKDCGSSYETFSQSADGRLLTAANWKDALIVDAATGKTVSSFTVCDPADSLTNTTASGVDSVSISGNGKFIAATRINELKVWNVTTHECLLKVQGTDKNVRYVSSIALSPDGDRIATNCPNGIQVFDVHTGRVAYRFDGYGKPVFSPDGRLLCVRLQQPHVVDAATGKLLYTLTGHDGQIQSMTFDAQSRRIATAGFDRTVRIWDAATGRNLYCLRGHSSTVNHVAFSPDGSRLASDGQDHTVRVWDTASGQEAIMFKAEVFTLNFTPDGRSLIAFTAGELRAWDAFEPPAQVPSAATKPTTEPTTIPSQ